VQIFVRQQNDGPALLHGHRRTIPPTSLVADAARYRPDYCVAYSVNRCCRLLFFSILLTFVLDPLVELPPFICAAESAGIATAVLLLFGIALWISMLVQPGYRLCRHGADYSQKIRSMLKPFRQQAASSRRRRKRRRAGDNKRDCSPPVTDWADVLTHGAAP